MITIGVAVTSLEGSAMNTEEVVILAAGMSEGHPGEMTGMTGTPSLSEFLVIISEFIPSVECLIFLLVHHCYGLTNNILLINLT